MVNINGGDTIVDPGKGRRPARRSDRASAKVVAVLGTAAVVITLVLVVRGVDSDTSPDNAAGPGATCLPDQIAVDDVCVESTGSSSAVAPEAPDTTATATTVAVTTTLPAATDQTTVVAADPPVEDAAPAVAPPSSTPDTVFWSEQFQTVAAMDRLAKEVHAGEPVNYVPQHFNGDHNEGCEGPLTPRPLVEDHTIDTHFWWCAPKGPDSGHFMTGIDTSGYVIISFAPSGDDGRAMVFPAEARRVCWDQNLTDLGGRKWTQFMAVSEASYLANDRTITYLNPGNPDNFSAVNPQARPAGDDFTIKFLKNTVEAFIGQDQVFADFFQPANGITDKAARFRTCVEDRGGGTMRFTQNRPAEVGEPVSIDFPGAFPAGPRVFIIGDDSYNVLKSYEEGATQYVTDPFTWHWDNLEVSG